MLVSICLFLLVEEFLAMQMTDPKHSTVVSAGDSPLVFVPDIQEKQIRTAHFPSYSIMTWVKFTTVSSTSQVVLAVMRESLTLLEVAKQPGGDWRAEGKTTSGDIETVVVEGSEKTQEWTHVAVMVCSSPIHQLTLTVTVWRGVTASSHIESREPFQTLDSAALWLGGTAPGNMMTVLLTAEQKKGEQSSRSSDEGGSQSSARPHPSREIEDKGKKLEIEILYLTGDWSNPQMQKMCIEVIPEIIHYIKNTLQISPKVKMLSLEDLKQCPHFPGELSQQVNFEADVIFEISVIKGDDEEFGRQIPCVLDEGKPVVIEICLNENRILAADYLDRSLLSLFLKGLRLNDRKRALQYTSTCDPSCLTCAGPASTDCLTCQANASLQNSSPSACVCNTGYFPNPDVTSCQVCDYSCSSCTGPSSSDCSTCHPNASVQSSEVTTASLQSTALTVCVCNTGYFPNPDVTTCQVCDPSCSTCSGSTSSDCTACQSNASLQSSAVTSGSLETSTVTVCVCNTGTFPNPDVTSCQVCDPSCFTCSGSTSSDCTACQSNASLQSSAVTSGSLETSTVTVCVCNTGTFPNPDVTSCQVCDPSCFTCSGSTSSDCTACQSNASLQSSAVTSGSLETSTVTVCVCNTGTFPNPDVTSCQVCDPSCSTCSGSTSSDCTACQSNASLQSSAVTSGSLETSTVTVCVCNTGTFPNPDVTSCQVCDPSCFTCSGSTSSDCTACQSNASLQSSAVTSGSLETSTVTVCVCNTGTFPNPDVTSCQVCDPSCFTCSGSTSSDCTACQSNASLQSSAVTSGSLETSTVTVCVCNTGTFPNPDVTSCQVCDPSCSTCSGSTSSDCTACQSNASLQSSAVTSGSLETSTVTVCVCNTGTFPNPDVTSCQVCDPSCFTCSGSTSSDCTACQSNASLQSSPTSACVCDSGYFKIDSSCQQCDVSCLECTNQDANSCSSCKLHMTLASAAPSSCVCAQGYVAVSDSSECAACDLTCETCSDTTSGSCNTCYNNASLSGSAPSSCTCNSGFYPSPDSSNCLPCASTCATCSTISTLCLTCFTNAHLANNNTCVCDEGAFPSPTEANCLFCDATCAACVGSSVNMCTSCKANAHLSGPSPQSCVCDSAYYLNESGCVACDPACLDCATGAADGCLTCKSNASLIGKAPASCSCNPGYQSNASLPSECVKCKAYFSPSDLTAYIDQTFMKLIVTFSKPVDTSQVQSCDLMFTTDVLMLLGDNPSCAWSADFKSITVVLGLYYSLRQQTISLISDNMGALNSNCTDNKTDLNITVTYSTPRLPPIAVITAPSSYSRTCSSGLQLSGLGSTNTRSQRIQYQWLLILQPSQISINTYARYSNETGKIVLSNAVLTDESLNVTLLILDSFGDVGRTTSMITLSDSNPITVSMDATNPLRFMASKSVVITSRIQQQCGDVLETYKYRWRLFSTDPDHPYSQTSETFQLWIAPNSLTPDGQYTCTLNVTGSSSQGNTQISVIVLHTPLIIAFDRSSGDQSRDTHLVIDASKSTDPDNPSALLNFAWNCSESTTPCLNSKMQTLPFASGPQLLVLAADLRLGATYLFTLLLQSGSKEGSFSIAITIVSPVTVSLKIPSTNQKLPTGLPYVIYPNISAYNDTTYQWTQISGKTANFTTPLSIPWGKVGAGQIQSGESYKFTLTLTQGSQTTSQVMQLTSNLSPTYGSLYVSPTTGVAITDEFTLEAPFWDDPDGTDYPLTYQFGVILDDGTTLYITTAQLSYSYVTYFYPGVVIVTVIVCDSVNACSSANSAVNVTPPSQQRGLTSVLATVKAKFTTAIAKVSTIPSTIIAYAKAVVLIVDDQFFQMMLSAAQTYISSIAIIDNSAVATQLSCCVALVALTSVMGVNNIQNVDNFIMTTIPAMYEPINNVNLQTAIGVFSNLTVNATTMKVINTYIDTLLQDLGLVPEDVPTIVPGTQITIATVSVVTSNSSSLNLVVGGTEINFPASFLNNMGIPTNSIADLRVSFFTPPSAFTPYVTVKLLKAGSVSNGNVLSSTPTPANVSNLTSPVNIGTSVANYTSSCNYSAYYQLPSTDVWSTSGVSINSINAQNAVIQTYHFSLFKVDIREVIVVESPLWPVLLPYSSIGCGSSYSPIILAEGYVAISLLGIALLSFFYRKKDASEIEQRNPSLPLNREVILTADNDRNPRGLEEKGLQLDKEDILHIPETATSPQKDELSTQEIRPPNDESSILALNPVFGVCRTQHKLSRILVILSLFLSEEMTIGIITKANSWDIPKTYNPGTWSYLNFMVCLIGLGAGQVYSWFCMGLFLMVLDGKVPSQVFCAVVGTLALMFNAVILWLAGDMCDDDRLNTWTSESISVLLVEIIVASWVCGAIAVLLKPFIRTKRQF